MILYIFKTMLCSALFLLIYFLLLEKEKMLRFKRLYLLCSIAFSFAVPFITIKSPVETLPVITSLQPTDQNSPVLFFQPTATSAHHEIDLAGFCMLFYTCITGLLFYRFSKNLFILFYKIKNNPRIIYKKATLVLISDNTEPYTFLKYIFINKDNFENGAIQEEVLLHELTHVQQKHTIDILAIEFLLVFAWLNPVFYLYKKAIQLNHEFLADSAVVKVFNNTHAYQLLLLSKASSGGNLFMTNHFNYSVTKKRLIMLTKTTSFTATVCRQAAVILLSGATVFIFGEKGIAQSAEQQHKDTAIPVTATPKQQQEKDTASTFVWGNTFGGTKEGVSQELLDEYADIINKYKQADENWMRDLGQNITSTDKERLITIFKQMNKRQQNKQDVQFFATPPPLPKSTPTTKQFEAFKNPKIYGVWIDGKKVSNSVLQNYRNTDFVQVGVSKLYANARRNVNYYYQVNLSTKDYYEQYYKEAMARRQEPIMVTIQKFDGKNKNQTTFRTM